MGLLDVQMPLRDVCYLVLGICAMAGSLYAVFSGQRKSVGDEREKIVRIDANVAKIGTDVSDIKAELRSVRETISDHERRIIKLEEGDKAQWKCIDDINDDLKVGGTE